MEKAGYKMYTEWNNNDRQNRRILIEFNTEADKRGEQQRKQYYTILRTINHLLV